MKKAKLKAKLETERILRERTLKRQQEYFDALRILWEWDGDPAVRAMINSAIPSFKSRMMFITADAVLKEWYTPQLKAGLEATNIWLSTSNLPKSTNSDGEQPVALSVKTKGQPG